MVAVVVKVVVKVMVAAAAAVVALVLVAGVISFSWRPSSGGCSCGGSSSKTNVSAMKCACE